MYVIRKAKKKATYPDTNYSFKDFKGFYEIAENLDVPIFGKYAVIIKTEDVEQITEFINNEQRYSEFVVYIYTSQAVIDYMSLRKPDLKVDSGKSEYQTFVELIKKHGILFSKGVDDLLYKSIEHSYEEMDNVLLRIKVEYPNTEITEKLLEQLVVLNKVIYPRVVLMAYLRQDRWRLQKLRKCVEQMGNDIVYWSIKKTLKKMITDKTQYLKSGINTAGIKYVDSNNLMLMYRTFVVGSGYLTDVELLMRLYEEGVTVYDIVQEDTFSV